MSPWLISLRWELDRSLLAIVTFIFTFTSCEVTRPCRSVVRGDPTLVKCGEVASGLILARVECILLDKSALVVQTHRPFVHLMYLTRIGAYATLSWLNMCLGPVLEVILIRPLCDIYSVS